MSVLGNFIYCIYNFGSKIKKLYGESHSHIVEYFENYNFKDSEYMSRDVEYISKYFNNGMLGSTTYSTKRNYDRCIIDKILDETYEYVRVNTRSFSCGGVGGQCITSYPIKNSNYMCTMVVYFDRCELHILEIKTLNSVSFIKLPTSVVSIDKIINSKNLSKITGVYTFMDPKNNFIIGGSDGHIRQITPIYNINNIPLLYITKDIDLTLYIDDKQIVGILPDFSGRIWFTTRSGAIYILENDICQYIKFEDQLIEKSFSINRYNICFILTTKLLYAMQYDKEFKILWTCDIYSNIINKESNVSSLYIGSGTTPVLIGDLYVVLADNDVPFSVLFIDQKTGVLLYKVKTSFNLTQCSLVVRDESSVIIVNNENYNNFMNIHVLGNTPSAGVALIKIHEGVKWCNINVIPSTCLPLYSVPNDVVILYTLENKNNWYLTVLSGNDGNILYKILIGSGLAFDNHWCPILCDQLGCIIIGTINGIIRIYI